VTGYNLMSPLPWSFCFFAIVFPIVNLPLKLTPGPSPKRFRAFRG
jgi:hypothetical protein